MSDGPPSRRILDVIMTLVIASIALMILGQVVAQILYAYMLHLIIAGVIVIIVWLVLRAVVFKRLW